MIKLQNTLIPDLKIVHWKTFTDARGFFSERFNIPRLKESGLEINCLQVSHSHSVSGVLRGMHFQRDPGAQGKLVGVTRGRIWDVAVDIRPNSPHFGQSVGVELSDQNALSLWIPRGFAHGFCVLGDEPADMIYVLDAPYNPKLEDGLRWDDPELKIKWPEEADRLVADRDRQFKSFAEYRKSVGL